MTPAETCGSAPESLLTSSRWSERGGNGPTSHNGPIMRRWSFPGAHPHPLQPSMSGSRTRHTFRASADPTGLDRSSSVHSASAIRMGLIDKYNVKDKSKDVAQPISRQRHRSSPHHRLRSPVLPASPQTHFTISAGTHPFRSPS